MISSSFNGEAIESPEAFENALHDRYPDASLSLNPEGYNFAEKICAGTNLETLNKLKSQSSQDGTPNQEEHYFLIGNGWNGFLAYDEEVRGLFKLKDDKSDALFPDIPKQIIIVPGMEYCRPSRIDESIGWY